MAFWRGFYNCLQSVRIGPFPRSPLLQSAPAGGRLGGMGRTAISIIPFILCACRGEDDAAARRECAEARVVEERDPRAGLEIRRRVWEEMPFTGTPEATRCGREIAERLGRVRLAVSQDQRGDPEAVEGCAFALEAVEVFAGSARPPFRRRWAERLLERCLRVVGRAWTREPESPRLEDLYGRLKRKTGG